MTEHVKKIEIKPVRDEIVQDLYLVIVKFV
jgi:hypothetical protein